MPSPQCKLSLTLSLLTDVAAKKIGLQLQEEVVGRHTAIYAQRRQRKAAVFDHGFKHLARLFEERVARSERLVTVTDCVALNGTKDGQERPPTAETHLETDSLKRSTRNMCLCGVLPAYAVNCRQTVRRKTSDNLSRCERWTMRAE